MNFPSYLILVCLSINSFASELRSLKLKRNVCEKIKSAHYFIEKENCIDGEFNLISSEKLKYKNKNHTVSMLIEASFLGSTFKILLDRSMSVHSDKAVFSKWQSEYLSEKIGSFHTLIKTGHDDDNVKKISKKSIIKKLPSAILSWESMMGGEYTSSKDYEYYKVYKGRGHIGYIAYVWYESEIADIKGYESQNFDLKGNLVGDGASESWGFYE